MLLDSSEVVVLWALSTAVSSTVLGIGLLIVCEGPTAAVKNADPVPPSARLAVSALISALSMVMADSIGDSVVSSTTTTFPVPWQ